MDRRTFLKTAAVTGVAAMLFDRLPGAEVSADETPDLAMVSGGEPAALLDAGLAALGGIGKFVKPGQTVTVKPNIAWDQPPEMAANTHPELVARIVKACFEAGAAKVQVFDTTCNPWRQTYEHSGIAEAAKRAGATVVGGDTANDRNYLETYYAEVPVPKGTTLHAMMVHKFIRECDVLINVPVLKVHGGAAVTCCMKNLMGIVSKEYQRKFHASGLNRCIAECASVRRPDLNIVDAYRVMTKRGPRGVDASDVRELGYLLAGRDMVALDTAGAKMLQVPPRKVGYLAEGEELGLGTRDLDSLNIRRITL